MDNNPYGDNPFYTKHVFMCVNVRDESDPRGCCSARGSVDLRDYMKAKAKMLKIKDIRINQSLCLDRCLEGPSMVIYPEGVWYRCTNFEEIDEVLEKHLIGGEVVKHLLMAPRGETEETAAAE